VSGIVRYTALERCFVDGALRQPGEAFTTRRFDPCPAHLREMAGDEPAPKPAKKNGPKAGKDFAGATAADMGVINGLGGPGGPGEGLDLTGLEAGAASGQPD
jgi:hypothetical protein